MSKEMVQGKSYADLGEKVRCSVEGVNRTQRVTDPAKGPRIRPGGNRTIKMSEFIQGKGQEWPVRR